MTTPQLAFPRGSLMHCCPPDSVESVTPLHVCRPMRASYSTQQQQCTCHKSRSHMAVSTVTKADTRADTPHTDINRHWTPTLDPCLYGGTPPYLRQGSPEAPCEGSTTWSAVTAPAPLLLLLLLLPLPLLASGSRLELSTWAMMP